jgi:bifunctional non-homologous end joining protein LigD
MDVSNPDRVMFPEDGITKGEVFSYYEKVAERMLPHIEGRALTVQRFPKGIGEMGFMQKNAPDHYPADLIGRFEVPKEGGGTTIYPVIGSTEAITFFANLGVITFHVPPVRAEDEHHPDWLIWDLDPPEAGVDLVRAAARSMRDLLDGFGVVTLPLASGSKGYHLRARVQPTIDIDQAALIARGTAALAAVAHDDLLTTEFLKKKRRDRVFIDWMRNAPRSTSVAPWSLRPRPGAPVAVPLDWDEVGTVEPNQVTMRKVDDREGFDPLVDMGPVDMAPVVQTVAVALDEAGIELEPFDRFRS